MKAKEKYLKSKTRTVSEFWLLSTVFPIAYKDIFPCKDTSSIRQDKIQCFYLILDVVLCTGLKKSLRMF